MAKRKYGTPSAHDLAVWEYAEEELFNYLYQGIAGKFQIEGHRILGNWSRGMKDQTVMEIGCGHGHHLVYSGHPYAHYIGMDHKFNRTQIVSQRPGRPAALNADAFQLTLADNTVDCVLSIYILEHLRELRAHLLEIRRVLKDNGSLLIALPAEGGFLYGLGRSLTSKPYMEKKYGIDYDAIVHYEHVNTYRQVYQVMSRYFKSRKGAIPHSPSYPQVHLNTTVCLQTGNR